MASTAKDVMIVGLRNAHAVESQAIQILKRQVERTGDYPELQSRVRQHLQESERQQSELADLLARHGTSPSTLKDAALGLAANLQAMGNTMAEDEIIKNTQASFAFEHFEIAAYRMLITMARRAGDPEVERVCQGILRQEEDMAKWLGDHLDGITESYLLQQGHA